MATPRQLPDNSSFTPVRPCSNFEQRISETNHLNTNHDSLIPSATGLLRLLRLGLILSCIGWSISFWFAFGSWASVSDQFFYMGAGRIAYQPMLDYWMRMAGAAFGCIGIASGLACLYPRFFRGLVFLLGPFHLVVGAVLFSASRSNQLDPDQHPTFVADITFCFVTAALILGPLAVTYFKQNRHAQQLGDSDVI